MYAKQFPMTLYAKHAKVFIAVFWPGLNINILILLPIVDCLFSY